MLTVFPDYYTDFSCIQGACRHNCCIGWEIDIDPAALNYYNTVCGKMGERLRQGIVQGETDTPHFLLDAQSRCPFLNADNLCDIILTLGEEHLCGICADHPRFRNELPDRVEIGLGLCCEAAAQLILSQKTPMRLIAHGESAVQDPVIIHRNEILALLQDRRKSVSQRVTDLLTYWNIVPCGRSTEWVDTLLQLERLDEDWARALRFLQTHGAHADTAGFDRFMQPRQTEYEQLLVYFIYRHMANAPDCESAAAHIAFAVFAYHLLHDIGAAIWTHTGDFPFSQQVELARLFSSEIEYSDENHDILLDLLM